MSDIWTMRMMTFITTCCVLVTALICFSACAGICEEISQAQTPSTDSWQDHQYETHSSDMSKMGREIELLQKIYTNILNNLNQKLA